MKMCSSARLKIAVFRLKWEVAPKVELLTWKISKAPPIPTVSSTMAAVDANGSKTVTFVICTTVFVCL